MSWQSTVRAIEAAERRREREAQRRQREVERSAKERAKLSAIEQARLEVESYENRLDMLLSVHKTQGEVWDWLSVAAALSPPSPQRSRFHEMKARQLVSVWPPDRQSEANARIEQGKSMDEEAFKNAGSAYDKHYAEWVKLKSLARRILSGEHKSFIEALVELSPLGEISDLGSQMHFTVESTELMICKLKVNGLQAIPSEVKSLTASEKLSVKPMSKTRFHEVYQDYICGCVLRVAREVFAILPVNILLITALADMPDKITSGTREQPVLSAAVTRTSLRELFLDEVNPSDAITKFTFRSNFKASRKSGAFQSIVPLSPAEIAHLSPDGLRFAHLKGSIAAMHEELKSRLNELIQLITDSETSTVI
jgi:hypothetical protein